MSDSPPRPLRLHPIVIPLIVFVCALLVRGIVLSQVQQDKDIQHPSGDGQAYLQWANDIINHGWIGDQVFYQTPLYPYFLAILRVVLGPGLMQIRIMQAMLGAGSCALLAFGTWRFFDRTTGLVAGLILALYPAVISFDLQIDKAVFDPFLTAALIATMGAPMLRPGGWRLLGCGVICGLLALNRENALVLLAVLLVWAFTLCRDLPIKRRWRRVGLLAAGAFLVLFPVALRNSLVGHEFHLITAQFGPNFYIGNNAQADGIYDPLLPDRGDARYERTDATALAEQAAGHPLSPGGVSHYWTARTLHDIAADPQRWLRLLAHKFVLVLTDTELADSHVHDRFIVWSGILYALDAVIGFGLLFALSAAGIALAWQQRAQWWPIALMALLFAPSVAVFYVFARYRLTLVTLLIPFAAAAIVRIPATFRQPLRFLPAGICALIALVLVWLGGVAIPARIKGTNPFNRANIFAELKENDRAIRLYHRAIEQNPQLFEAHRNLGRVLATTDIAQATTELAQAVKLNPRDRDAQMELGAVLGRQKLFAPAVEHLRIAFEIDPNNTTVRYNLGVGLLSTGQRDEAIQVLRPMASATSPDPMARQAAAILARIPSASSPGR